MSGFISGLRNCHIQGVNSYVLRDRISPSEGMIRVFHCEGARLSALYTADDFSIAPHNHRQDITLYHLYGNVANVSFGDSSEDGEVHEYLVGSALLGGQFSLERTVKSGGGLALPVEQVTAIPRSGLFLTVNDVHTIVASPASAWLVIEGQQAPETHQSLCYSTKWNLQLKSDGLYIPMSENELCGYGHVLAAANSLLAERARQITSAARGTE